MRRRLGNNIAAIDPDLDANLTHLCARLGLSKINIRAQRMERHTTVHRLLAARDLRPAQPS